MSKDIFRDIREMHDHFGVRKAVLKLDVARLREFLRFRADCVAEEVSELEAGLRRPEEVVDALIDIMVFAAGTLDLFGVDGQKAWDEVLKANTSKEVGVKEGRPNPYGLPDLVKPAGWEAPSHADNHGYLDRFTCSSTRGAFERCPYGDAGPHIVTHTEDECSYTRKYSVNCNKCGRSQNGGDCLSRT
jgi:hypothetical protein